MTEFRNTNTGGLEVMQDGTWMTVPQEAANALERLTNALGHISDLRQEMGSDDGDMIVLRAEELARSVLYTVQ